MPSTRTSNQPRQTTIRFASQPGRPAFMVGVDLPAHMWTKEDMLPLFRGAKQWLIEQGLTELRRTRAVIVAKRDLPSGVGGRTWGGRPHLVQMKPGPAVGFFVGLLCHEWLECWFFDLGLGGTASVPWQREGICEIGRWTFYRALNTRYTTGYQQGISNNTIVKYREGFRRQRKRFAGQSLREIAQYIRRTRRLT